MGGGGGGSLADRETGRNGLNCIAHENEKKYDPICNRLIWLTSNVWAGYSPRLLRARYAPATRRRFFAREPYYRSLMARLSKHK